MSTTLTTKDVTNCPDGAVSVSGREGTRLKLKRVERKGRSGKSSRPYCAVLNCTVSQEAQSLGQFVHVVKMEDKLGQV